MKYSTFNQKHFDHKKEYMFFGNPVNVSRYDEQKYSTFVNLINKQNGFYWVPEEISGMVKDRSDFESLSDDEKRIFIRNLQYQTLLDSVQGRSPNVALLPIVSLPELETWIETWAYFETIHSRSYTFIMRSMNVDYSQTFDNITKTQAILKRAAPISKYYDDLIEMVGFYNLFGEGEHTINGKKIKVSLTALKKQLYLTLVSINILEGIRFYVSFACTFSFGQRGVMEGNSNIIKLIARDEALHLSGTQFIINTLKNGKDDPEFVEIAKQCEAEVIEQFKLVAQQESQWVDYLFKNGGLVGLSNSMLKNYLQHITDVRLKAIGYQPIFGDIPNPLPWMQDWLDGEALQVAPQETNITDYIVGAVNNKISNDELKEITGIL